MKLNLIMRFDKFFITLQKDSFQKKLKITNLTLSVFSVLFLANIINEIEYDLNFFNITFIEFLICFFYYLSNAFLWISFMRNNYSGSKKDYFYNWAYSKIGKYIPGGLMIFTVRLNQKVEKNKDPKNIFYGVIEEHFLAPAVAIISISLTLIFYNHFEKQFIFFISTVISFFVFKKLYSKYSRNYSSLINSNLLFLIHLNLNFLFFFFVSNSLGIENSFQFALLYFLSASLAILFIGIPAGIGVREIIFYFISGSLILDTYVFSMMIRVRIILLIFDLIFGLIGIIGTFSKNQV